MLIDMFIDHMKHSKIELSIQLCLCIHILLTTFIHPVYMAVRNHTTGAIFYFLLIALSRRRRKAIRVSFACAIPQRI